MEFLELPTPKKHPIRDYRMIDDFKTCYKYLSNVFDEAVKRINEKYKKYGPTKGEFVHYICEKLRQAGYEISENELYYLVKYYNNSNEKNRKACLTLIRTNLKIHYLEKEEKEREKEFEEDKKLAQEIIIPKEEKLSINDEEYIKPSEELKYAVERTNATGDYDNLYIYHDLDEIDKYTNALKKGRR